MCCGLKMANKKCSGKLENKLLMLLIPVPVNEEQLLLPAAFELSEKLRHPTVFMLVLL